MRLKYEKIYTARTLHAVRYILEFTFQSLSQFQYNVDLCSGFEPLCLMLKSLKQTLDTEGFSFFISFLNSA